jgi:hypothetical protein
VRLFTHFLSVNIIIIFIDYILSLVKRNFNYINVFLSDINDIIDLLLNIMQNQLKWDNADSLKFGKSKGVVFEFAKSLFTIFYLLLHARKNKTQLQSNIFSYTDWILYIRSNALVRHAWNQSNYDQFLMSGKKLHRSKASLQSCRGNEIKSTNLKM